MKDVQEFNEQACYCYTSHYSASFVCACSPRVDLQLPKENILTVYWADVIWQMSRSRRGSRSRAALHQQVTVRASLAGHKVVVLSRVGPWRRRGEAEEGTLLQVFVGHYSKSTRNKMSKSAGFKTRPTTPRGEKGNEGARQSKVRVREREEFQCLVLLQHMWVNIMKLHPGVHPQKTYNVTSD